MRVCVIFPALRVAAAKHPLDTSIAPVSRESPRGRLLHDDLCVSGFTYIELVSACSNSLTKGKLFAITILRRKPEDSLANSWSGTLGLRRKRPPNRDFFENDLSDLASAKLSSRQCLSRKTKQKLLFVATNRVIIEFQATHLIDFNQNSADKRGIC